MRALIAAVHGIDSTNASSFVEPFEDYCAGEDGGLQVISHEYVTGPFPLLNNWWIDRHVSGELCRRIMATKGTRPVFLVAHSNGTVIALRVAKELAAMNVRVAGMILIAGAIDSDVQRNGVLDLFKRKALGFAAAYCSRLDDVVRGDPRADTGWWPKLKDRVWGAFMWPYGSLGVTGWLLNNDEFASIECVNRWYNCSHSGYFDRLHMGSTFEQILSDIKMSQQIAGGKVALG